MNDGKEKDTLFEYIKSIAQNPPHSGSRQHAEVKQRLRQGLTQELENGRISQETATTVLRRLDELNVADLDVIFLDFDRPVSERVLNYQPPNWSIK
jgi:hypothetical protein